MWVLLIALIILVDQVSKLLANYYFQVEINSGISFSFLQNNLWIISPFLGILIIVGLVFWYQKKGLNWKYKYGGILMWGGAISNYIDRIWYGGVRDWFLLDIINLKNNFADWCIFFGICIIIFGLIDEN